MKAAIYSRKSKFTGKGDSIENQIQLCREYGMKYLGIGEADFAVYEDEGFSGGNTNRPQFQRLLKDAAARKFDVLICYRLDRISRNVSDFSQLIKELNRFNVNFVSIREQFDTTTPMGRAMMYIASVFSQLERETIAERIRDNMLQLAKTGRWLGGVPPTGFKSEAVVTADANGKERKMYRLVPVQEEINVVRLIYDKYISFKSITRVEKFLTLNKIYTKNGQDFHRYSIRFILSNPVYSVADRNVYNYLAEKGYEVYSEVDDFNSSNGLIGYNKTRQDKENTNERHRDNSEWIIAVGLHKGIIPGSIWIQAQELLSANSSKSYRRIKTSQALLSGILRCAGCGSFMRPKSINRFASDGKQAFYYICELKEKSAKSRCTMENINGNTLDRSIMSKLLGIAHNHPPILSEIFEKKDLICEVTDTFDAERELLKAKIREAEAGIRNMVTAIAKGQNDEIISVIMNKMDEMTKEKDEMVKRLLRMQEAVKSTEFNGLDYEMITRSLKFFSDDTVNLMDTTEKRNLITSAVEKVVWDGRKIDVMLLENV